MQGGRPITTECNACEFSFQALGSREVTDDPIHGHQLGRFFHGYYDNYCYLPLYIFCGEHLLCAKLRPSDIDGAAGAVKQLAKIVERIRQTWTDVRIIVRGDSGFCRENLIAWCERNRVDYVLGLAKNARLQRILGGELHEAKLQFEATGRCDTFRLKLLKLGAIVRLTVRRVWILLSSSCPYQRVFAQVHENLRSWSLPSPASG